jgi:hypothetical protein
MTDVVPGAKKLAEGQCPLCGERLGTQITDPGRCGNCRTSWTLTMVAGEPWVQSSRSLGPKEVRKLVTGE